MFSLFTISAEPTDILVLNSYHGSLPWSMDFYRGLQSAKSEFPDIEYHIEYMESDKAENGLTEQQWAEYLLVKYNSIGIDAIIGDTTPAADFICAYPELFGQIPQVFYTSEYCETEDYQFSLQPQIKKAVLGTIRIAMAQNPEAKKAVVINGGSSSIKAAHTYLMSTLSELDIETEEYSDFTLEEIHQLIQNCNPNDIVFYTLIFNDRTGKQFVPRRVLTELSAVSAAPIYSFWGALAGSGCVGGLMIDASTAADEAVKAAVEYLDTGTFSEYYTTTKTYIDWRALKNHHISPSTIPADAVVLNKPKAFFITYYKETVTIVSFIFLVGFVAMMFLLRRNQINTNKLSNQSKELKQALLEKEVLYNEMNNRIKNNLLLLSGVISLQLNELDDKSPRQQIENVIGRLKTLALVHEELSNQKHIKKTNVSEYLRSLISEIFNTMTTESSEDKLTIDIDDVMMDNKNSVACGLIVNELLTNAIKYSYLDGTFGIITVKLKRSSEDKAELSVSDSGSGLPANFNLESDSKLGLKIVQSLVKQLHGTLSVRNNNGAVFRILFKL